MTRKTWVTIFIVANAVGLAALVGLSLYVFVFRETANPPVVKETPKATATPTEKVEPPVEAPKLMSLADAVTVLRNPKSTNTQLGEVLPSLQQLAADGNKKAMFFLALMLQEGVGTSPDLQQAFSWYRKAAQKGNDSAMVKMAEFYRDGVWVNADEEKSKKWLKRAEKAGNADAAWLLAEEVAP